ncbi:hypothetical protein ACFL6I_08550 [candidate division KSB1 bacterium]
MTKPIVPIIATEGVEAPSLMNKGLRLGLNYGFQRTSYKPVETHSLMNKGLRRLFDYVDFKVFIRA